MYWRLATSLLSAVLCACATQHAAETTNAPPVAAVEAVQAVALPEPVETGTIPAQDRAEPSSAARPPVRSDAPPLEDAAIIQQIITSSRAGYPGPCACPYDRNRAGRKCGATSAYSKPGGYSPICFAEQVTPAMIERRRSAAR